MVSQALAALLFPMQGSLALRHADKCSLVETASIPSFGLWLSKCHDSLCFKGGKRRALRNRGTAGRVDENLGIQARSSP